MTVITGGFLNRKEGISVEEFRNYYENIHTPLLVRLFGPAFPTAHRRHYPTKDAAGNTIPILGQPEDFDFDCYTECVFEDEEAAQKFQERFWAEGVYDQIAADAKNFTEQKRLRMVGFQVMQTSRPT